MRNDSSWPWVLTGCIQVLLAAHSMLWELGNWGNGHLSLKRSRPHLTAYLPQAPVGTQAQPRHLNAPRLHPPQAANARQPHPPDSTPILGTAANPSGHPNHGIFSRCWTASPEPWLPAPGPPAAAVPPAAAPPPCTELLEHTGCSSSSLAGSEGMPASAACKIDQGDNALVSFGSQLQEGPHAS